MTTSTSTWLKGSEYCFPLVYDHSVGSPDAATRSCARLELIVELDSALAASAFTNDRLDIPSNIKRMPSSRTGSQSHQIMG
jgi:hypothetical protein